jgi:hypothetical protein
VLGQVASSDPARQILQEMLDLEKKARAACGYDGAGAAMDASRKRLLESLHSTGGRAGPEDGGTSVRLAGRPAPRIRRVLLPVAVAAAVLISLGVALVE